MKNIFSSIYLFSLLSFFSCGDQTIENTSVVHNENPNSIILKAEDFYGQSEGNFKRTESITLNENQWLSYNLNVQKPGRYRITVIAQGIENSSLWIEDYIDNTDDRTYDISGKIEIPQKDQFAEYSIDGAPLNKGIHPVKVHVSEGNVSVDKVIFTPIQFSVETPLTYTQSMKGDEWSLVWSDEFDIDGLPDSNKWSYNVGNWGWGNNEPQYYTSSRKENARVENGTLIIEARKNDLGQKWTSARLSTQGRQSFLYGKIEFRAKVPVGRGTWAAGWLLGDEYKDELSWPYCGEIDVLECVGFEIDDESGKGKNHATCHTRAYYFKQGNQIGSEIEVENMNSEFHTYSIEWYPDVIYGFVDGEKYYTYDKNKDELEWPFFKAQNIILNLAVGGGWGGAKGIDESWENHQYVIDYVRVYELK